MEKPMKQENQSVELKCVNTIRALSVDAIEKAKSGHPGLPLGAAPMAYVLWRRHLRHAPSQPGWPNRDRFVLSGGHGSALLYSLLHLSGYGVSMEDLKAFRQWGSLTPGHPEFRHTPGVEATTGPLGQGAANSVGMAIAEAMMSARYVGDSGSLFDHHTYALVTDGDLMEGVVLEAASLAGHLGLGKLVWLYDSNDISLDGPLTLTMSEDTGRKFEAMGWHVLTVSNGDADLDALDGALAAARMERGRPTLIIVKTTIGYGSPHKAGSSKCHGSPLGAEEVRLTKEALGVDSSASFHVPEGVRDWGREAVAAGDEAVVEWEARLKAFGVSHPILAGELELALAGQLPSGWSEGLVEFQAGTKMATRKASGLALNALADRIAWLVGGDADLGSSTQTTLKNRSDFGRGQTGGGNVHYGVREHAMAAIANGMAYHGGVRNFVSTFFAFADYMRPSIRLAAMNRLPVTYVWTHDSIGVGEDGPTHQPVEQLMSLRVIPGLDVVRPADANETLGAWQYALKHEGPVALVLTRQDLPILEATQGALKGVEQGAYVLKEGKKKALDALIVATGSEVHLALAAAAQVEASGHSVRVVSMPCMEAFLRQPQAVRDAVLPPSVTRRVSVEAGVTLGWGSIVGDRGVSIGIDRFGASAPAEEVFEKLGLTVQRLVDELERML